MTVITLISYAIEREFGSFEVLIRKLAIFLMQTSLFMPLKLIEVIKRHQMSFT